MANVEPRIVASIYVYSVAPSFDIPAFDGTVEEFFMRAPKPLRSRIKEYLNKELLASYWSGILTILRYAVADNTKEK